MAIPSDCRYTREHEWARPSADGTVVVGITDYAQEQLGDIVFLELPKEGEEVSKDEPFGEIESTKSASELFAPVSGRVVETNDALLDHPEMCNEDPYEEGWLIRIEMDNADELDELMTAEEYEQFIGEDDDDDDD